MKRASAPDRTFVTRRHHATALGLDDLSNAVRGWKRAHATMFSGSVRVR
jgi:hypothetical protein